MVPDHLRGRWELRLGDARELLPLELERIGRLGLFFHDSLHSREHVLFEPGRRLVGEAGVLLTRVLYLKPGAPRGFAIVDAAMNDLIRPSLYGAWHDIVTVSEGSGAARTYDVVGPVCESTDFLGVDRSLRVEEGDLLAILSAGAYSMVMSSNYNTRPRPPEVLVDGERALEVRSRETIESLFAS